MGGPAKELPLIYNPNSSFPSVSGATTDWFKSWCLTQAGPSESFQWLFGAGTEGGR